MAASQRGPETFMRHQYLLLSFTPYLQLHEMPQRGVPRASKGFSWQKAGWEVPSLQKNDTKTLIRGLSLHRHRGLRREIQKCSSRPRVI